MNSINKTETDMLLEWAFNNEDKSIFLSDVNEQKDTFWKLRSKEDTYIMPYSFKTISEFEKLCTDVFEKEYDSKIQRIVSVAAFKNGESNQKRQGQEEKARATDMLPEYIYVF